MLSWPRAFCTMIVWPSSKNGYPRSIRALLETSLAGMRVLPFLGYSLRTVVPPLLLEDRLEEDP